MARLIRHTAIAPFKILPENFPKDKAISICLCGLSQNLPFCDGAHKRLTEDPSTLYVYDQDRKCVVEQRPDQCVAAPPVSGATCGPDCQI